MRQFVGGQRAEDAMVAEVADQDSWQVGAGWVMWVVGWAACVDEVGAGW